MSLASALRNLPTFGTSPITTPQRSPNLQPLRGDLLSPQAALSLSGFAGAVAPPGHPPMHPIFCQTSSVPILQDSGQAPPPLQSSPWALALPWLRHSCPCPVTSVSCAHRCSSGWFAWLVSHPARHEHLRHEEGGGGTDTRTGGLPVGHTQLSGLQRFHVPCFITRYQSEQETGRERKERGKEGPTQTTALPSLTSQHGLEVSPLNFRRRASIHREVGHLLGRVHGGQRLPALKGGRGAGTPLTKASQAWGWTAQPRHCIWSPCHSPAGDSKPASSDTPTRTFAQMSGINNLRPPFARQRHRNLQHSAATQNTAFFMGAGHKGAIQQRKTKGP